MKTSEELFLLINSLSRSEKSYFKKTANNRLEGGSKNYILLFDTIAKQKIYNEAEIKQHFSEKKFTKQLTRAKDYLYSTILKCLGNYHAESSLDIKLTNLLAEVEILYHKALFRQCEKVVLAAEKLALEYERDVFLPAIYAWKKATLSFTHYKNDESAIRAELFKAINNEDQISHKKIKLNSYTAFNLFKIILCPRVRKNERSSGFIINIEEILNDSSISRYPKNLTRQARQNILFAQAIYYEHKSNSLQASSIYKKLLDSVRTQDQLIPGILLSYFFWLTSVLVFTKTLKKDKEFLFYLNMMKRVSIQFKNRISRDFESKIQFNMYNHELIAHARKGEYQKAANLIEKMDAEKGLNCRSLI